MYLIATQRSLRDQALFSFDYVAEQRKSSSSNTNTQLGYDSSGTFYIDETSLDIFEIKFVFIGYIVSVNKKR